MRDRINAREAAEAVAAVRAAGSERKAAAQLGMSRSGVKRRLIAARGYDVPTLPSSDLPLDQLLALRRETSRRVLAADAARKLIPINIKADGPVGLLIFGDPHIDDDGCDFVLLEQHLKYAADRSQYLFAGNIGDVTNNWIGRLSRLYANQQTTASDAWRLAEWLISGAGVQWLFLVNGNHDVWSGAGDPLKWIARESTAIHQNHSTRLALTHPEKVTTRIHARHDFKGNSIYHDLHGLKREVAFGHRDHLIVAGHRHIGGDEGFINPDGGITQLVRVSGYKRADDFAHQLGLKAKPIHPAALIILDPSKQDSDRSRCWCAPDVETGVAFLDYLRRVHEGRRVVPLPRSARKRT